VNLNPFYPRWLILIFFVFSGVQAHSQTPSKGEWLRQAISASERIADRRGLEEDAISASLLHGFIAGSLAVHRGNNLNYSVLVMVAKDNPTKLPKEFFRTAVMFTPLLFLPDSVTDVQAIAILKKYLDDNPAKWNESAMSLLQNALARAYPLQK